MSNFATHMVMMGRGGGALSSNPLAVMRLVASRNGIVFVAPRNLTASGNAYPWLLCILVEHIS